MYIEKNPLRRLSCHMKSRLFLLLLAAGGLSATGLRAASADSFPVTIQVHAAQPIGPFKPIWRFFGADEPNYATQPNGEKLIGELGQLRPDQVYFRTHNLLNTGDG